MYKNEHMFSIAICKAMKNNKMHPVQIETGLTQQGVPDLFVMTGDGDVWVELKNMPYTNKSVSYEIQWRPGQQAWHSIYYKKHGKRKYVITVVALNVGYIIIQMTKLWDNNIVSCDDTIYVKQLHDVVIYIKEIGDGNRI